MELLDSFIFITIIKAAVIFAVLMGLFGGLPR